MMSFKSNFSKALLLANQNITFTNEENKSFELVPLKVLDIYTNEKVNWFLSFLEQDINELQKMFPKTEVLNHYRFLILILTLAESKKELQGISLSFLEALEILLPGIHFKSKTLYITDIKVNEELFYNILNILYMVLDKKPKIVITEEDDALTRRMKEKQIKVQEIKSKGRKINQKETAFEDMFAALLYEFPQYKLEDLFQLNIYTFHFLFKYIGKIANYEVSKIAAGNGLAKKHKYFIEK